MSKRTETEEKILEAARNEFQKQGFSGARMQDIADAAGINKSMLHYYFRSKDQLFQKIFRDGVRKFVPVIFDALNSDLALVPKIEKLVSSYYSLFEKYPHLPGFIIHEMNQHPERFRKFLKSMDIGPHEVFVKQLEAEIEAGKMKRIDPREFIINTIGLCVFPIIARPMITTVFDMKDTQFQQFIEKRKKELPEFILNAVKK